MVTNTDIYNELKNVRGDIKCVDGIVEWLLKDNVKTVASQRRTIDYLIDALRGKYEHGLFVFTEEGKFEPTIIKDGQVLTDGRISRVDITWGCGDAPVINIEHACGN